MNLQAVPSDLLLRGWLDKKKSKPTALGSDINRRWFVIDIVTPLIELQGPDSNIEYTLSYYKSPSTKKRLGWIFLSDVESLETDDVSRWISIRLPTRTFRLRSTDHRQFDTWCNALDILCTKLRHENQSNQQVQRSTDAKACTLKVDSIAKASDKAINKPTQADYEIKYLGQFTNGDTNKEESTLPIKPEHAPEVGIKGRNSNDSSPICPLVQIRNDIRKDREKNEDGNIVDSTRLSCIHTNSHYNSSKIVSGPYGAGIDETIHSRVERAMLQSQNIESEKNTAGGATTGTILADLCDDVSINVSKTCDQDLNDNHNTELSSLIIGSNSCKSSPIISREDDVVQLTYNSGIQTNMDASEYVLRIKQDFDSDCSFLPDDNFVTDDWDTDDSED